MSVVRSVSGTRRVRDSACHVSSQIFKAVNSDFSKSLLRLVESGDWISLLSQKIDPSLYDDPVRFSEDYLCSEILSKFPDLPIDVDRSSLAISKFLSSEVACHSVNQKFKTYYDRTILSPFTRAVLFTAREKIARLLGPFSWDEAELRFGFGPGATFARTRAQGDAYYKFGLKPSTTPDNAVLAEIAVRRVPLWFSHLCQVVGSTETEIMGLSQSERIEKLFDIVPGNRIVTVPKTAKIDRIIAIEPCMNMYIQKGIGSMMRSRLKRVGVNLDDQTWNQTLAKSGSANGQLATLDLSSASDTVSCSIVRELLPPDWTRAIFRTRSSQGVLPSGELVTYQKVSSMGNGFTFELESMIFWALASSVKFYLSDERSPLAIYGDDIVISAVSVRPLISVLSEVGFSANLSKTWITGPFRESCGEHYFRGVGVKPFYIKSKVDSVFRQIWLANRIKIWSSQPYSYGLHPVLSEVYHEVCRLLPRYVRSFGTSILSPDTALVQDFDEYCPPFDRSLQCYVAKGFIFGGRSKKADDIPFLLRCLHNLEKRSNVGSVDRWMAPETPGGIPVVSTYRVGKIYTSQWPSLGPWLNAEV